MLTKVRQKRTGTFDWSTSTWKLRITGEPPLSVSVKKLNKLYGTSVPHTEAGSRSLWRRYLQDHADRQAAIREATSPIPRRIESIRAMIDRYRAERRSDGEIERLERMLAEAVAVPSWSTDHSDQPIVHPDMETTAELLGLHDELSVGLLNQMIPTTTTTPAKDSVFAEAEEFINRKKVKGGRAWRQPAQAIELFKSITGDISIREINVKHYRQFLKAARDYPTWDERTQYNQQGNVKSFLERLEADHDLSFGFLRNKDYNLQCPDGQKIKWTIDEVKTGLKYAEGDVRLALLLGLNCGLYWSDMWELDHEQFDGHHLSRHRAKNKGKKTNPIGSWLLWNETRELLHFNIPKATENKFYKFRIEHDLPIHKALRKTTSQIIEDDARHGEAIARLFRNERSGDGHGKFYSEHSPAKVKQLDKALITVAKVFGLKASVR